MGMDHQSGLAVDVAPAWDRPLVTVPAFALLALIGGFFPSFSLAANLYVLVLGGAMMWFGLSGRVPKRPSPTRLTRAAAWWLVPAGILLAFELTDFALGSTYAHPTVSLLTDPALDHYSIRSVAYFAWLGAFWGLVRR
jgi:hypothetical protein